jgi:hypothetical protein
MAEPFSISNGTVASTSAARRSSGASGATRRRVGSVEVSAGLSGGLSGELSVGLSVGRVLGSADEHRLVAWLPRERVENHAALRFRFPAEFGLVA